MHVLSLTLVIIGVAIGIAGALYGNLALTIVSSIVAVGGAILQFLISRPFVRDFDVNDWRQSTEDFVITVPAWRHLRGHVPAAMIYLKTEESYEVVICDESVESNGSFIIRASQPFQGRIVLK